MNRFFYDDISKILLKFNCISNNNEDGYIDICFEYTNGCHYGYRVDKNSMTYYYFICYKQMRDIGFNKL